LGSVLDPSTTVSPDCHGGVVTPVGNMKGISAKMGLDATRPVEYYEHVFTRVRIPGEDKVDLQAVLDAQPTISLSEVLAE
jgi:2,5-furandicarboxylate decarboxylase 1